MQVKLSLETLGELDDGSAGVIINRSIDEAVKDVDLRGGDGKERKVAITLLLKRMDNGMIATAVEAASVLPKMRTHAGVALVKQSAPDKVHLSFSAYAPEEPRQATIDEAIHRPTEE